MRNKLLIAGMFFSFIGTTLPQASFAADAPAKKTVTEQDVAAPPDATIDFEAEQFRLIFGGSGGKGTLHFKGKDYQFTMKGASVGGVGVSKVEGTGVVHKLTKVEDFAGHYVGLGIGAAVTSAGKGASSFQNNKGVVVSVKSKAEGLALNMGINAIDVTLSK
jgi:hypothetical protein